MLDNSITTYLVLRKPCAKEEKTMNKPFPFYSEQTNQSFLQADMTKEERDAQLVVDKSILLFQKNRLMKLIDQSLEDRNQKEFEQLTNQYNQLLQQYLHVANL